MGHRGMVEHRSPDLRDIAQGRGAVSRFVYVHAVDYDRGGEWVGTNFM